MLIEKKPMNSDHAMLPGTRHVRGAIPCQDYAMSGEGWAIVSDGCSGGEETDLGARIWALTLQKTLRDNGTSVLGQRRWLHDRLLAMASPWLDQVGENDGLATLVAMGMHEGRLLGIMAGDGGFLLRLRDESFVAIEVNYNDNRPLYLDYFRKESVRSNLRTTIGYQTLNTTVGHFNGQGDLIKMKEQSSFIRYDSAFVEYDFLSLLDINMADIQVAMACTDGVFTRPVSRGKSLAELVGFHNYTGEFARRRLGSLGARWASNGTLPVDDLAIAAIHFD